LSYTSFSFANIAASSKNVTINKPVTITFTVKNTGSVAGAEVAQLYIHDVKSTIDRPVKELKGFKKVLLQPGQSKTVTLPVAWKDLAFWDELTHQWKVEPGSYSIEVGSSSQDIKQKIILAF
jgi:beta-glucosidase